MSTVTSKMRVSIQVFTHATPLELQWQVKKLTRLSNRNQLQHYLTRQPTMVHDVYDISHGID